MERKDILSSLQFAVNALTAATAGVCSAEILPEDIEDEITISINTDQGDTEVLIFNDSTVIIVPNQSGRSSFTFPRYGQVFAQMSGKPKNLPKRTCPRCRGQGKI